MEDSKKASTISLSSSSGTLTYGTNKTPTITSEGDGTISCTTSDSSVATCSVSGTTLTVTPKANTSDGLTATITVKIAAMEYRIIIKIMQYKIKYVTTTVR